MNAVQAVDWALLAPVLVTAATMLAVLLVQAVVPGRPRLLDGVALAGLVGAGLTLLAQVGRPRASFCTPFGCGLGSDAASTGLQAVVLVAALVCLALATGDDPPPGAAEDRSQHRAEHRALLLASVAGTVALVGARDLLTLLVALETASLPVIGLAGLRRDSEAAGAALRLLLVSVVSFAVTLLGVALLFAGAGTMHLDQLAAAPPGRGAVLAVGLAFAVAGIGYKVAALPFGLWVADVYPGVPLPVATLLAVLSKLAGVAAVALLLSSALPGRGGLWLAVLVAVTMTVANVVALAQRSVVALLAWSGIAQGGWAMLPLAGSGSDAVVRGAVTTYLAVYAAASLVAFTVVVLVGRHVPSGRRHLVADHAGLLRREPVAASALVLALLTLAGLPPGVAGLVAKIAVLRPVVEGGHWWLAVVAAVNVAIALAYYLRWVWAVVAGPADGAPTWRVSVAEGAALSVSAGLLVVLTVLPGVLT